MIGHVECFSLGGVQETKNGNSTWFDYGNESFETSGGMTFGGDAEADFFAIKCSVRAAILLRNEIDRSLLVGELCHP